MRGQRSYVLDWHSLARWDLKSARAAAFRLTHPNFRPLGAFVEEATDIVNPASLPDHLWPVFGVNNRSGVEFSHRQLGSSFNAAYKRIRKDWFFHNPTRANVGSLGRVSNVPDDAITSPEYQVWRVTHGLLPDFVEILIRLPFFLRQIDCHRVGAVKERLFVENLREIPIPVLSEADQREIIERWRSAHAEISKYRLLAEQRRSSLDAQLLSELGLAAPPSIRQTRSLILPWNIVDRWGVSFNVQKRNVVDLTKGHYEVIELAEVVNSVQYGTSTKAHEGGDGDPVIRMNNIVDGELDLRRLKYVRLPSGERERMLLRDNDILVNRTNSKELVGKAAVFHEKGQFVFASYLIRVRLDDSVADANFVAYVLNSTIGRRQIDAISRQIIGQANINTEELLSLELPLPPLPKQRVIVTSLNAERAKIAADWQTATRLETQLTAEIEALVFERAS